MSHAYRSPYDHMISARIAAMRLARQELVTVLPELRGVRNARVARIGASVLGITGAAAMALACAIDSRGPLGTQILLGSALLSVVAYVLLRGGLLALPFRMKEWRLPAFSGRLDRDLELLEEGDATKLLRTRLDKLEVLSMALPMAAITLLVPLSLHWLFTFVFDSGSFESFSWWIAVSLVIVGHAHLALVYLAARFVSKMKRATTEEVAAMPIHQEWAKALGITIVVSAVPGIILIAVPPVLSAVTGLAFVPLMFLWARRTILNERRMIAYGQETAPSLARVDAGELLSAAEPYAQLEVMQHSLGQGASPPDTPHLENPLQRFAPVRS